MTLIDPFNILFELGQLPTVLCVGVADDTLCILTDGEGLFLQYFMKLTLEANQVSG